MNKRLLIIPKQIVTMNSGMEILRNHGVQINNGTIEKVCNLKGFEYEKNLKEHQTLVYMPLHKHDNLHIYHNQYLHSGQ